MSGQGCKCGSSCSCGSDCKCGNTYDLEQTTTAATIIQGVAPIKMYTEGSEMNFGAEGGHACKCGSSCTCDPCNC